MEKVSKTYSGFLLFTGLDSAFSIGHFSLFILTFNVAYFMFSFCAHSIVENACPRKFNNLGFLIGVFKTRSIGHFKTFKRVYSICGGIFIALAQSTALRAIPLYAIILLLRRFLACIDGVAQRIFPGLYPLLLLIRSKDNSFAGLLPRYVIT